MKQLLWIIVAGILEDGSRTVTYIETDSWERLAESCEALIRLTHVVNIHTVGHWQEQGKLSGVSSVA